MSAFLHALENVEFGKLFELFLTQMYQIGHLFARLIWATEIILL